MNYMALLIYIRMRGQSSQNLKLCHLCEPVGCWLNIMKLKLVVNAVESPTDYKLLRTTFATVASIRSTAVLRFTDEKLVVISTPKLVPSGGDSSSNFQSDADQLWCTIPKDVFNVYVIDSVRDSKGITLEYNCGSMMAAFKRYDRVVSQGTAPNLTIKLGLMPELSRAARQLNSDETGNATNPMGVLSLTFEEIVYINDSTPGKDRYNDNNNGDSYMRMSSNSKVVSHNFKVPIKMLFKKQDRQIAEPMISYENVMMYKLPPSSGPFGTPFHNFMKRIERYTNVQNVQVCGTRKRNQFDQDISGDTDESELKIVVDEFSWNLEICWNGPLEITVKETEEESNERNGLVVNNSLPSLPPVSLTRKSHEEIEQDSEEREVQDMFAIEDSEMVTGAQTSFISNDDSRTYGNSIDNVSAMVERAEQESNTTSAVILRARDWKVCAKLYHEFDDTLLAISHDQACIFHCSLDRDSYNDSQDSQKERENGQIVYYLTRSKGL